MKKLLVPIVAGLSAVTLLTGCLGLQVGGGTTKSEGPRATIGQQLIDLQKAKDSGAITDAEYQTQKAKVLNDK
ncbi:MAG TPA: SHOCT domain-containing protein [Verrucomicrobiae bacterium]|nr:SHOCT domain-containing protein [Verrucomicrobiae bacterium]